MLKTKPTESFSRLKLHIPPVARLTDEEFFMFCQLNRDLRIERTAEGDLIIMTPAGGETGWRNSEITASLVSWSRQDGSGVIFDSSTGFILPNGATRSPDAAWVRRSRLATLTAREKKKFLPLCPDFVIELMLPSDDLENLQEKMSEYVASGLQLGWLIDPEHRQAYVYRPSNQVEELQNPRTLTGDPILPGFVLDLQDLWEPDF